MGLTQDDKFKLLTWGIGLLIIFATIYLAHNKYQDMTAKPRVKLCMGKDRITAS